MNDYAIVFARSARRELANLDVPLLNKIFPKIEALAKEPRPKGSLKLRGRKNLWRIRMGDYRVLYAIDDKSRSVDIIAIGHRGQVYR